MFKAGYYIDEFNYLLERVIDGIDISNFYNKNLFFDIIDFPGYINEEEINPLLKISWNILSRGEPTRASIRLSDNILNEYLNDDFLIQSDNGPEIKFKINKDFISGIEKETLTEVLENFGFNKDRTIAYKYGSIYLKIYKILSELIAAAQIQRSILLYLIIYNDTQRYKFRISGIRESLCKVIIDDINDLFGVINDLVSTDEAKLNLLSYSNDPNAVVISYNTSGIYSFKIESFKKFPENYYCKVFTDRRINFKILGRIVEKEVQGKYVQEFNYDSVNQKLALEYFLHNIFRKRKFKAGQEAIINQAIQGRDVIGLLPTGGGKSLTYQICALLQPGVTIVVDPINSLMKDQFDKLIENGFTKTNFINSFNTKDERDKNIEELTESKYLILFVSPERFQIETFRHSLKSCFYNNVYFSYAVIDEAHCVSEWGHDFRHTYLKLTQNLKRFCLPKIENICLFGLTATASFDVLADVQRELEMADNSIISLPAESIDRKELNFEILKIDSEVSDSLEFWLREKQIGLQKYPLIKKTIHGLPKKITKLESKYGIFNPNPNFFSKNGDEYLNAGVIFCPTKSNKLKNGVLSLYDYLVNEEILDIGTFFGGGSDDTIKDSRIENEAVLSVKNQIEFIQNRKNLMIATKAFGMGIDKPNIRFTIHYSFPNSVESFYQEAGRAGRDGNPSICSIIYHPKDILTNYDFYRNSFKGIEREIEIIDELLIEVKYEDNFYLGVLKRQIQDKYPEVHYVNLWKDRYIYINGSWRENANERIAIGNIDLERDLKSYDDAIKNFDRDKALAILEYAKELLRKESPDGNYLEWLKTKATNGIKTLIESQTREIYSLKIGFTNDTITKISEVIKSDGYEEFEEVIIRAAYDFSTNESDFVDNLNYQYGKFTNFDRSLDLSNDAISFIKRNYNKIRNSSDTQRAIYRMSIVGIIDDYVIDYVGKFIEVRFKSKSEEEYTNNFKEYLKRYLGNQTTELWLSKVKDSKEESILKRVLYALISFIEEEISDKRKRSIDYMKQLCELGYEQGEKVFRENIIYYFTSKYARMDYLPKDTDGGRLETTEIVKKYLNYISKPPDGLGGEIDNAKHLRGACANLRISMAKENASIDLLTAYSLFALEAKESDNIELALQRPLIAQAIDLYRNGFRTFLRSEKESWASVKELLKIFNEKILDINPIIKPLIELLTHEILLNRTTFRLNQFLNKIS